MEKSIGILGGGQLGMMMGQAALNLGYQVGFLDPNPKACAGKIGKLCSINKGFDNAEVLARFTKEHSYITYEWENVPASCVMFLTASGARLHPNVYSLQVCSDRLKEKALFNRLNIPTPEFYPVETYTDLVKGASEWMGLPLILKTQRGGYDGIGQTLVQARVDGKQLYEIWTKQSHGGSIPLIAEQVVEFDYEVSQIAAGSEDGNVVFYPLMKNLHHEGILRYTRALPVGHALEHQAQKYTRKIMEDLGYVGVICVEFFNVKGELYANEIAPRVHNSGHLTIEADADSQFSKHVKALVGLPLGPAQIRYPYAGMVNIIGSLPCAQFEHPRVFWHIYGKEITRPNQKLGHVTVVSSDPLEYRILIARVLKCTKAPVDLGCIL